jgi:AraC-like DNA-binding protein/CheY-like chemotaxis protein
MFNVCAASQPARRQFETIRAMSKPLMLWFDCTSTAHRPEPRGQCARFFDLVPSTRLTQAAAEIERLQPKVLCFDFDYPDQTRLGLMQKVKRDHMRLPILMFTVEHSEALAVWAFRARVWNYLVKPVLLAELDENLRTLTHIVHAERRVARAVTPPDPGIPGQLPSSTREGAEAVLRPAVYYIEKHFNEKISADEIARLCGLTRFRFSRLFHSVFGITFRDYLTSYRIGSACRLLRRPSVSVTEVAYAVGFNDASYFARMFKRYMGMLPSEYSDSGPHPRPGNLRPSPRPSGSQPRDTMNPQLEQDTDLADETFIEIA